MSLYAPHREQIKAWRAGGLTNQQIADRLLAHHGVGTGNGACIAVHCSRNRDFYPPKRRPPYKLPPARVRQQRDGGMSMPDIAAYWGASVVGVWKCLRKATT